MRLFVANPTRQLQRVFYRIDFDKTGNAVSQVGVTPLHQDIRPGQQESVGGDLCQAQIDSIIRQLNVYGAAEAKEVNRLVNVVTYLYSVDAPVSKSALDKAYNHNQGMLTVDGRKRREAAAIAASSVIASDEVKIGVEQMEESEAGTGRLAEGRTVNKVDDPGRGGSRRSKRHRAKANA